MFRCVTELKGLVIDIDSFEDINFEFWYEINKSYKCLFITVYDETETEIVQMFGQDRVYKMEKFRKLFAPSRNTHEKVLNMLKLNATEVVYVSTSIQFLEHAMEFLGGSIWITNQISYEDASKAPDLICRNSADLLRLLKDGVKGFLGEACTFPGEQPHGMIIPVQFEVSGSVYPLYMMGRYFGYSHYMSQLHPYSSAIFLNKKEGKSYYGKYDKKFGRLYMLAVDRIMKRNNIYGICSVPVRPEKPNRFEKIIKDIAHECGIADLSSEFVCTQSYPSQKNLSQSERAENIKGVFKYNGNLTDRNVIIIDDIISTGSTMRECIHELKEKGANEIFIVVLAVNQMQGIYWSSENAKVSCPFCDEKMHLLINGRTGEFFYSCYACHHSIDFEDGRELLCEEVNNEFSN